MIYNYAFERKDKLLTTSVPDTTTQRLKLKNNDSREAVRITCHLSRRGFPVNQTRRHR